jgi:hypothetical protein
MKEALELRYALAPYIYTQSRITYDTGISICRPLYYDSPDDSEAYKHGDEYMFGNDILAAPIVEVADANGISTKTIWLPEGKWYEVCSGEILDGNETYTRTFSQADIPYYYKEGAIIPNYPRLAHLKIRPENLILQFTPGADGELNYYEDENDNDNYINGNYAFTKITQERVGLNGIYTIYPVEGSFSGMLTARSYDLKLLAVSQPAEIKVNGVIYSQNESGEAETWKYDSQTKTAVVFIPKVPCNEKTEVKIAFTEKPAGISHLKSQKKASLNYYPKSKLLNISLASVCRSVSVNICNISGRKIMSEKFKNTQNCLLQVPFATANGIYIVDLNYDENKQIEKLIF